MARTADRPHDPFAPPVPAFPTNRLRAAGLSDRRLGHLADRFDEMSTAAAREFVNRVRTHPTHEMTDWFTAPEGDDIEAIAAGPRDPLVWLAASYGQPISGNRHELARLVVLGRDTEAAAEVLTATVDRAAYPDPDDLAAALDAVVPNQQDDETDEAYLDRLRAAAPAAPEVPPVETPTDAPQDGDQAPAEGEGDTGAPPAGDEAPTGDTAGQDTPPAETPAPVEAPVTDPALVADPALVEDTPAEVEVTHQDGTTETVTGTLPASAEVSEPADQGTTDEVTETPTTETPGETPAPVEGDAPTPVEGDAPVAVDGDTVTAVTGDASPEVSASMTAEAPAPAKRARKATGKTA